MIRTTKTGINPRHLVGKKFIRFTYTDVQLIIIPRVYFKLCKSVLRKTKQKNGKKSSFNFEKAVNKHRVFTKVTIFVRKNLNRKYNGALNSRHRSTSTHDMAEETPLPSAWVGRCKRR